MNISETIRELRIPQPKYQDKGYSLANIIGIELDQYSIDELFNYVKNELNCQIYLRTWLEDQIISAEINYQNNQKECL